MKIIIIQNDSDDNKDSNKSIMLNIRYWMKIMIRQCKRATAVTIIIMITMITITATAPPPQTTIMIMII